MEATPRIASRMHFPPLIFPGECFTGSPVRITRPSASIIGVEVCPGRTTKFDDDQVHGWIT
jgi:hypothetical protein